MPIGPAADSRASATPRRAKTQSVPSRNDLLEQPRDEEEPLDADRLVDELAAEDRVDVDPRQPEVARHDGSREKGGAHDPHGHGDGRDEHPACAAQAGSASASAPPSSSDGGAPTGTSAGSSSGGRGRSTSAGAA